MIPLERGFHTDQPVRHSGEWETIRGERESVAVLIRRQGSPGSVVIRSDRNRNLQAVCPSDFIRSLPGVERPPPERAIRWPDTTVERLRGGGVRILFLAVHVLSTGLRRWFV